MRTGRDIVVLGAGGRDYLHPDCETIDNRYSAYPTVVDADSVGFSFSFCRGGEDEFVECTVRLTLRQTFGRHRLLARGTLPRDYYGEDSLVIADLKPLAGRLARTRRGVRATVTIQRRTFGELAQTTKATWRIHVRSR